MGLIYKISNDINNKVYIGQTQVSLSKRWSQHKQDSKTKDNKLYRAIRKYGLEHFTISIVEDDIEVDNLDNKEIYYISYYNSYYEGYNSTGGGSTHRAAENNDLPKNILQQLWDQNLSLKEISEKTNYCKRTCSYWLQRYEIASQDDIVQRGKEKMKDFKNKNGISVIFNGKKYNRIKDLAIFLQENYEIFENKKINTIIQGISRASKNNTSYCGYKFTRI